MFMTTSCPKVVNCNPEVFRSFAVCLSITDFDYFLSEVFVWVSGVASQKPSPTVWHFSNVLAKSSNAEVS